MRVICWILIRQKLFKQVNNKFQVENLKDLARTAIKDQTQIGTLIITKKVIETEIVTEKEKETAIVIVKETEKGTGTEEVIRKISPKEIKEKNL